MRRLQSLYEVLYFPICVLIAAFFSLGLGNLLTNQAFSSIIDIRSDFVILIANVLMRLGSFVIVNFPLIFLIRLVARKSGSATTIISAFCGYIAFNVVTMYFARTNLVSTAYSSILGISMTTVGTTTARSTTHYPLQTGLLATFVISAITLASYNGSRIRNEYGFLSFISRDTWCVIRTVVLSMIAGVGSAYVWPYLISVIQKLIDISAADTTNPVNLAIYGVTERILGVLNMATLVRSPFWYGANGGSWISMAGAAVMGDVNIWTAQETAGSIAGMTGRFITPYYVLNLFAVPGFVWSLYFLQTDRLERRRTRMFYVLLTLISLFAGVLLPIELLMLVLSPFLFLCHVLFTGILFGFLQSFHIYLGFFNTGTATLTALPGTLMELLTYISHASLSRNLLGVLIVGIVSFAIYFLFARFYFKYLAADLFHTGVKNTIVKEFVRAVGGVENIKLTHSSAERLIVSLYDPSKLNVAKVRELGASRITETKAGYAFSFGEKSTMIRIGLENFVKSTVRDI